MARTHDEPRVAPPAETRPSLSLWPARVNIAEDTDGDASLRRGVQLNRKVAMALAGSGNANSVTDKRMRDDRSANIGNDDEGDSLFEFEDEDALTRRHVRWPTRLIRRTLPVLLLTALLLLLVGAQPNLARLFRRPAPPALVPVTVVCDVPWAIIHVDGHGPAIHCTPGVAGALPMARLSAPAGQHMLLATAEGFAPYPIYVVIHPQTPALYLTQFTLAPQGAAQALAAVNSYFARGYAQEALVPAALWPALGLRQPPAGPSVLVRERFEAVALDSYEPFYSETTYQRPIVPESGMVGIAVVVVEHVTVYDGCGAKPLLERRTPVLYTARASVTFSARPASSVWTVAAPYALNPAAEITTTPADAAAAASPAGLLAMAARTDLAALSGDHDALASAVVTTPLVGASDWAAGLALSIQNGANAGARWLYLGGWLTALTPAAQALTPGASASIPAATLDALGASLANQPARVCGRA